jgi:Xaa-Pro aminopeptidase
MNAAIGTEITVDTTKITHEELLGKILQRLDETHEEPTQVFIEDSITLSEYRALEKLQGSNIQETSGCIAHIRAVKNAQEIKRHKAAQAITDKAFTHIIGFIRPGMTEKEVQIELEYYMAKQGAGALAFPSIVATGQNGASPHAIAGETKLRPGQALVMDFGAKYKGYCSDMTRTVFLGQPTDKMKAAYNALIEVNEEIEALLAPGITGAFAHGHALEILAQAGFANAMGHSLGHGVGLEVHEQPLLAPKNNVPLEVGNIVTVEPGIYIPHEFGMRLEDFGAICPQGFDVFTQSSHDMVII